MKKILDTLVYKPSFLIWAILCVLIFISYPGSVTYLQGSSFANWPGTLNKLQRIDLFYYSFKLFLAFLGVTTYTFASVFAGSFMLGILRKEIGINNKQNLALLSTAYLMGQLLFSIVFTIFGETHQLSPLNVIITILIAIIAGGYWIIKFFYISSLREIRIPTGNSLNKTSRVLVWLAGCVLFLSLMYSSSRLGYDSVALYFSTAKITAMTHRILFSQNDSFMVSALQTDIHQAALIQVFGDQAARMHAWISAIIIIIFSLALSEQVGLSKTARVYLVILILSSTAFVDVMGDGKVDLASAAAAIATVYWMVISGMHTSKTILRLVGVLAALAIISRPYNIMLLGIMMGIFYLQLAYSKKEFPGNQRYKFLLQTTLTISTPILCLFLYHLFTNWIVLGDPISFIHNLNTVNSADWQWRIDPKQIWLLRLIYPFTVTFYNNPQSGGSISPLFVAFLPGLLLKDIRKKTIFSRDLKIIVIASVITISLWIIAIFTIIEIRYVLFLWIILYIPLAIIIESLVESNDVLIRSATNILLVGLLLFISIRIIYISLDTYSPEDRQGNPRCYDTEYCDLLQQINQSATPRERILTLTAYRYYLRSDLFACSTQGTEYVSLRDAAAKNPDSFWEEVYRQGYSFIAYEEHYSGHRLFINIEPRPDNAPSWMQLIPIYGKPGEPLVAYKIVVNSAPTTQEKKCVKNLNGAFDIQIIP